MELVSEIQTTTVGTEGQVAIPAEMLKSLGIPSGGRVLLRVEGNRIILQPVTEKLIDEMMGRFAGGPSMADELQRERRAEDEEC